MVHGFRHAIWLMTPEGISQQVFSARSLPYTDDPSVFSSMSYPLVNTHSYCKRQFIMDFPPENGDILGSPWLMMVNDGL